MNFCDFCVYLGRRPRVRKFPSLDLQASPQVKTHNEQFVLGERVGQKVSKLSGWAR